MTAEEADLARQREIKSAIYGALNGWNVYSPLLRAASAALDDGASREEVVRLADAALEIADDLARRVIGRLGGGELARHDRLRAHKSAARVVAPLVAEHIRRHTAEDDPLAALREEQHREALTEALFRMRQEMVADPRFPELPATLSDRLSFFQAARPLAQAILRRQAEGFFGDASPAAVSHAAARAIIEAARRLEKHISDGAPDGYEGQGAVRHRAIVDAADIWVRHLERGCARIRNHPGQFERLSPLGRFRSMIAKLAQETAKTVELLVSSDPFALMRRQDADAPAVADPPASATPAAPEARLGIEEIFGGVRGAEESA